MSSLIASRVSLHSAYRIPSKSGNRVWDENIVGSLPWLVCAGRLCYTVHVVIDCWAFSSKLQTLGWMMEKRAPVSGKSESKSGLKNITNQDQCNDLTVHIKAVQKICRNV